MVSGRLLAALVVALAVAGCAVEQRSGQPPLEVVSDDVTWLPTDGYDGSLRIVVRPTAEVEGVIVEADVRALARQAEVRVRDDRCGLEDDTVTCRLGDLADGAQEPLAVLEAVPSAGIDVSDGIEVPVSVRTRTSDPATRPLVMHPVTGPRLLGLAHEAEGDLAADAEVTLNPGLLNVGAEPADGAHLVIQGGTGTRYASSYANCRPILPDETGAVCTFEQTIAPHAAMRTEEPLAFAMTGLIAGSIDYSGGPGAADPEDVSLGLPEGPAPELRLVPADPGAFRSPAGGVRWGGTLELRTGLRTTIEAVGATLPSSGETTIEVGVVNRGPGVVDLGELGVQDVNVGTITIELPDGAEVLDIPFEEGWATNCSPQEPGQRRYECRIPERLDRGEPYLQQVRVRVDDGAQDSGSVTLRLAEALEGFDADTADDTAPIRTRR